ncbi:hypothetical protein YC2023_034985 [Brassica napus]
MQVTGLAVDGEYILSSSADHLITLSDTKGLYVLEPSATKIWNILRSNMDADLGGVEEKKFPMLIKRDSLEKEKDHIEGFKPEVACVTRAGEPARPSSTYPYTHGVRAGQQSAKNAIGFIEVYNILQNHAIMIIGREEGVKGYWKGNLPQVIRIVPYSAVQLFAYEAYKAIILFWFSFHNFKNQGEDGQLSVLGAGACAGMTSTLITYPLDVLRLRLAVEPGYRTMSQFWPFGVIGLYRGFVPNALKSMPNSRYVEFLLSHARLPLPLHIPRTRTGASCKLKRRRVEEHLRCRCAQSEEEATERYGNGTSKRSAFMLSASSYKSFIHTSINQEFTSDNH